MSAATATATPITLISSDKQEFKVDKEVAYKSVLIKNMVEDFGGDASEIPLPRAQGKVLKKVLEYCEFHRNDPEPKPQEERERSDRIKRTTDIIEWDYKFMNVDNESVFEIMLLANYLDIRSLFELTCKTVANMIKGKTPEQIRQILDIENDFTPEQLDEIRRENEWAEDP